MRIGFLSICQVLYVEIAFLVIKIQDLKIRPGTYALRTGRTICSDLDTCSFAVEGSRLPTEAE